MAMAMAIVGSNEAGMTITLKAASTVNAVEGAAAGFEPTDIDGHNAARLALTEVAAKLRSRLPTIVDQMEKDMLLLTVGETFFALG